MKTLKGKELEAAQHFVNEAIEFAKQSTCRRAKGGSVIVSSGKVIGSGFNSQPCEVNGPCFKEDLPSDFRSDRTCCVHAEQRAILKAMRKHPWLLRDSRIYYVRLDPQNNLEFAGKPYCTICSKLALDVGIAEFVLVHKEGITVYPMDEYNRVSFHGIPDGISSQPKSK